MSAALLLASPRRRELLRLVWDAERAAGDLHRAMPDVTFGAVSQHLRVLADAGLVRVRADGRRRLYRALPDAVGELRPWLESHWSDALARLTLLAELESSRRGPRARPRRKRPSRTSTARPRSKR